MVLSQPAFDLLGLLTLPEISPAHQPLCKVTLARRWLALGLGDTPPPQHVLVDPFLSWGKRRMDPGGCPSGSPQSRGTVFSSPNDLSGLEFASFSYSGRVDSVFSWVGAVNGCYLSPRRPLGKSPSLNLVLRLWIAGRPFGVFFVQHWVRRRRPPSRSPRGGLYESSSSPIIFPGLCGEKELQQIWYKLPYSFIGQRHHLRSALPMSTNSVNPLMLESCRKTCSRH